MESWFCHLLCDFGQRSGGGMKLGTSGDSKAMACGDQSQAQTVGVTGRPPPSPSPAGLAWAPGRGLGPSWNSGACLHTQGPGPASRGLLLSLWSFSLQMGKLRPKGARVSQAGGAERHGVGTPPTCTPSSPTSGASHMCVADQTGRFCPWGLSFPICPKRTRRRGRQGSLQDKHA